MVQHDPTLYAHAEELVLGNIRFKAFDLGGYLMILKNNFFFYRKFK